MDGIQTHNYNVAFQHNLEIVFNAPEHYLSTVSLCVALLTWIHCLVYIVKITGGPFTLAVMVMWSAMKLRLTPLP